MATFKRTTLSLSTFFLKWVKTSTRYLYKIVIHSKLSFLPAFSTWIKNTSWSFSCRIMGFSKWNFQILYESINSICLMKNSSQFRILVSTKEKEKEGEREKKKLFSQLDMSWHEVISFFFKSLKCCIENKMHAFHFIYKLFVTFEYIFTVICGRKKALTGMMMMMVMMMLMLCE